MSNSSSRADARRFPSLGLGAAISTAEWRSRGGCRCAAWSSRATGPPKGAYRKVSGVHGSFDMPAVLCSAEPPEERTMTPITTQATRAAAMPRPMIQLRLADAG